MTSKHQDEKSEADKIRDAALAALAELGGRSTTEDDIEFRGKKFILPENLASLDEGISFLEKRRRDEEQEYTFSRQYRFRPEDGAVATAAVIRKLFGTSMGKPIITIFGSRPPELRDVAISTTQTVQAPFGLLELPGLDGLEMHVGRATDAELGIVFQLSGSGPRKFRFHVSGFFDAVQRELEENSIYRGKAINGRKQPEFLDLSSVDPNKVVYAESVLAQLKGNVWTPIVHAEELRKRGHNSKRAVLFEGPYGTGKTLAAYLTGQVAEANGWTFILVRPGKDSLEQAIQTARMYQPAVVFTEDIDTSTSANAGDSDHMSKMLDLFDGIESKSSQLMLVLTTNNVESLHPAMLRPGRLDAVISIKDLDVHGVEKLTRVILNGTLSKDIDWVRFHKACEGYTPAFLREALSRTDIFVLGRNDKDVYEITTDDLVNAAESLRPQWELMEGATAEPDPNPLARGLEGIVAPVVEDVLKRARFVDGDGDETFVGDSKGLTVVKQDTVLE